MATTKQQEREALAKIKKIVEALGEDSYIGAAFAGCFELAEENIEFDFACNLQDRAEAAEREATDLKKKASDLERQVQEAKMSLETTRRLSESYETQLQDMGQKVRDLTAKLHEIETLAGDHQRRAEDAEGQIIRLKAQLYDFMVAAQ